MDCGGKRSATPLWLYRAELRDCLLFIEERRRRASLAAAVPLFMTPIVAKEIRLLLPAYVMALLLAIVPIWLLPGEAATIFSFCFGAVILAVSCLGREFALGTFPLLLVQPLERSRIWWTKIRVLAIAMITVMAAWLLSVTFARFALGHSLGFELGRSLTQGVLLIGAAATVLS